MKFPETPQAVLFEKQKWEEIINSADWVAYRNALKEHVAYLQREVNDHIRNKRDIEAFGALRAMDDSNKFLDSINVRMKALNEQSSKGGK